MGKLTVLLAILGFGVFAIRQTSGTSRTLFGVQSAATDDAAEVIARSSALAGFTRAEQALTESFEDVTLSGAFEGASYTTTVSVTVPNRQATVTSRGILNRSFAPPDTFEIHALVMPLADPEELPEFLNYGMLVGGDLSISGSSEIVTMGFADPDGTYNPLVHTNGDLNIGSASTRVSGFGSYSGMQTGKSSTGTFRPPYNPDGLPPLEKKDPVEIPTFDPDAIVDAYGTLVMDVPDGGDYWDYVFQDVTLTGGTREDPAIYRIHGNAKLLNIVVDGYAVFVVDGHTNAGGSVRAINPDPEYPNQSQIAIYTGGELSMIGGAELHAQVVAEGGLSFRGNVDIYGSLVTHSNFSNGGGATMHIRPASPALSRPWQEGTAGIGVLAYTEYGLGTSLRQ